MVHYINLLLDAVHWLWCVGRFGICRFSHL